MVGVAVVGAEMEAAEAADEAEAMVEAVGRIRPKVFVAENVKALLKQPEWLEQVLKD